MACLALHPLQKRGLQLHLGLLLLKIGPRSLQVLLQVGLHYLKVPLHAPL